MLYARVLDAHLETALDVMGDMLLAPSFDPDELDSEREVVLEEIAMYEDTPHDLVHDLIAEAVFADHPLGRPVIGTAGRGRRDRRRRRCATTTRNRYVGPNIVDRRGRQPRARAAGARHPAALRAATPRCPTRRPACGRRGSASRSPQTRVPGSKATEQYHVCLGGLGLPRSDRRRFAASLLDSMLGGSASSRLFQEIRERRGMAYSVYTFALPVRRHRHGRRLRRHPRGQPGRVHAHHRRPAAADRARASSADDELQRAKENLKGRIMLSMESTSNRASRLGKSVLTDTELLSLDRICAEIDAVEPEAVAALARQLFAPDRLSVAGIGPDEDRFREAVAALEPRTRLTSTISR